MERPRAGIRDRGVHNDEVGSAGIQSSLYELTLIESASVGAGHAASRRVRAISNDVQTQVSGLDWSRAYRVGIGRAWRERIDNVTAGPLAATPAPRINIIIGSGQRRVFGKRQGRRVDDRGRRASIGGRRPELRAHS